MVDIATVASFILPFVIDEIFGSGFKKLPPLPNYWRNMIKISSKIYNNLNFAQKELLQRYGLKPEIEKNLIKLFDDYLTEESFVIEGYDYSKFYDNIINIDPDLVKNTPNPYSTFKQLFLEIFPQYKKIFKESRSDGHPNYFDLFQYWKKINKIKFLKEKIFS
ncbi:MAG: hypothetical protein NZZ41_07615 [Candidatus Dojkabacteria bacterium]|nr:hypothetical protein [Candidatus Dojkabacteria bacterium]